MMSKTSLSQSIRLHATIEGRVQGVGFRAFVEDNAIRMDLTGWVRNRWNGAVEVIAEGERQDLEKFLAVLRRGPRAAFVTDISYEWLEASGEFSHFSVRMTG
jgi:acylphosphatase